MFCKWCGYKIVNNGLACPTCGKEQDKLENGNGFWDLYKDSSVSGQNKDVSFDSKKKLEMKDVKDTKLNFDEQQNLNTTQKSKSRSYFFIGASCFLLLIVFIEVSFLLLQIIKLKDRIDSTNSEIYDSRDNVIKELSDIKTYIDISKNVTENQKLVDEGIEDIDKKEEDDDDLDTTEGQIVSDEWKSFIDKESESIIKNSEIFIELYEISSLREKLLIVNGIPVEYENAMFVWQRYDDHKDEWITIAENQLYIMINDIELENSIRVMCVVYSEDSQYKVYEAEYFINKKENLNNEDDIVFESDKEKDEQYFSEKAD